MKLSNEQKSDWLPRIWEITRACYSGAEFPDASFFNRCVKDGDVWTVHGGGELGTNYEIVGYALASTDVYSDGSPLLRSIAVMPEWRGQGLGRFLLDEINKYYAGRVPRILLHTKIDNPAQKLYFDAGYRVRTRLKNYYAPEGDGLEMEKAL